MLPHWIRTARELHRRDSTKRDNAQGILTQQPSPEVQSTDSPMYLPSHTGTPNDHASYNPSDANSDKPRLQPSYRHLECAFYRTTMLDAPFRSPPLRPVANKPGQEHDRWTPGDSEYGRSACKDEQEVRDPGRQHHSTPFPRYSSDLLPEEYDSRYDACHERNGREDHFRVQLKNPDEGKQKHDCDDEERSQNSNRTQSQDEESYTPRSPSATSPPERGFGQQQQAQQQQRQRHQAQAPRIRSRNGAVDGGPGLVLHKFDPAAFQHTPEQLIGQRPDQNQRLYSSAQINSPRHMTSPHQIQSPSHEEPDHFLDNSAAAYYHGYRHSPMAIHARPGAPNLPTLHSHTAAPLPSPLISGMGRANGMKSVLPPTAPSLPSARRTLIRSDTYVAVRVMAALTTQLSTFRRWISTSSANNLLQMQIYALNNGGMVSGSTLSPSSTPFPGSAIQPLDILTDEQRIRRCETWGFGRVDSEYAFESQSPTCRSTTFSSRKPRLTPASKDEESAGEFKAVEHSSGRSDPQRYAPGPAHWDESADDEDDEDVGGMEGVADDLLQLEFHTDYVGNPSAGEGGSSAGDPTPCFKCPVFHALDRETDTTLVFLAAPSQTGKLHSVASRAFRRDSSLHKSTDMASSSSRDGSPSSSSDAREEDLRRALDTAIRQLARVLRSLYERWWMRWIEEKRRLDEDKEKVQLLLKQVLGVGIAGNLVDTAL
ncbi:hypothetical protein V8E53_012137 [Lactarius tabidus]